MFRILITALVSALLAMPVIALTTPERLEGDTANASFGFGLRDLGDINDDGYPDFAVGAHKFTNGESEEGAIFLYLGTPSGPSTTAAWQYESNVEDARLGVALAAGDLNGMASTIWQPAHWATTTPSEPVAQY